MSHRRSVPFAAIGLTALLVASAAGLAAAAEPEPAPAPVPKAVPAPCPATAPASQPVLPGAEEVPGLDDAKLYGLYLSLFPDPTASENEGYATVDPQRHLKAATWSEIAARADERLASFLADPQLPAPDELAQPGFFLILYGAIRHTGHQYESDENALERRRQIEPIVRQAIVRGGKLCDLALTRCRLDDVGWMTDAQLRDALSRIRRSANSWDERGRNRERILCEILRRRGPAWEKTLTEELHRIEQIKPVGPFGMESPHRGGYLEMLTALRRLQGKPDPLHIELAGPARLESVFPALPSEIEASLVNLDADPYSLKRGGDYRSGRQARWRIEARDSAGTLLPEREMLGAIGGGLFGEGPIAPGEKWTTQLDIGSFLPALPPGEYTLRVLYHDGLCIADEPSIDGLIVSSSSTLKLTVKPLEIPESKVDAAKVRDLLAAIDEKAKLKVVGGTYGNWAYDLVAPDSPQGKLLAIGLPAVATLLETLDDPKLTPQRRAVVLSLLYSLTSQNDPTSAGPILGAFKKAFGPWAVVGDGGGGFGISGSEDVPEGNIDAAKQVEFAKRWSVWKQYVKVVPAGK